MSTTSSFPDYITSTIGHLFSPKVIDGTTSFACEYFQTIFLDEGVSMEELRVKDYQLGGRPPSYPLKPEFCGVSLAPERHSLFDIEKPPHPNEIEESHSPPPHLNDLWYDDGSVVLKAGNDFFRVHGSILSQKSSVFATILLQSQTENTETHEGCPVVALGDDAEELRQLLLTIYEISYFEDNAQYFVYLCAVLRLSTKYEMKRLRDLALQRLKRGVPTTLASFDDPEYQDDRATAQKNVLAVINLARETKCLELFPCAYYYCSRLPTSTIFKGSGGVILALPDITACMLGKEQLLNVQRQTTHPFLYTLPKKTKSGSRCKNRCEGNDRLLLEYLQRQDFRRPCTLEQFIDWEKIGACKNCASPHQSVHTKGRQEAWAQLPGIFGLESWEKIAA
ncbi:uncharacterized protein F5891DRAFT_1029566 [Suillus fuscotomentosus]|uniref:BTB domain-containing protein n=1 Tax=Suillus fuscotomentosus TaxID=1912939 RepID=A0AAD4E827_9AGAM|nr:uncharacterized protein F5891DRAFT_1029566 [Suillus fuscotomentosus]KAG1901450.1 hypothetical protein F5891DRAFT_1029566 [Suillus fuscotomentosus]